MKKISSILTMLITICNWTFADFVELNLEGKNIPIDEVVNHFDEWFNTGNSQFELFFDEVDALGMRDMDYQQYVDGIKVKNCALYVHSRNGYVTLINGDIMPIRKNSNIEVKVPVKTARRLANAKEDAEVEITIIHTSNTNEDTFYKVYRIINDTCEMFIDVNNGEIIKSIPLANTAAKCSVHTFYGGQHEIECEKIDGMYQLRNDTRNLRTCFGVMSSINDAYPTEYYAYTNSTTNWDDSYLTSVTIKSVSNSWWNGLGNDTYPELYIRIKNGSGAYIYTSDYKEDCGFDAKFPVTFYFSRPIRIPKDGGYIIEIWDQDITTDTKGMTLTMNSGEVGVYNFGTSNTNCMGTVEITEYHPAFDIQWGLQNTYDFYKNVFGFQGVNGSNSLIRAFLHYPGGIDNQHPEHDYTGKKFWVKTDHYNNAYATGDENNVSTAYLFFGMGNERSYPMLDLNTISHEYTHLVTKYRPKKQLEYLGESGAINEGYSDAMAITCEHYLYGATDWIYCNGLMFRDEDRTYTYIRNIQNPKNGGPEGPKPTTYGKTNWIDPSYTSYDNGGVHQNNSIFTYWYYLLCEGGIGTNDNQNSYNIQGIGIEKARQIIWRMHRTYLPPQATFLQARIYAIQSAKDLYPGNNAIEKAVTNAWYAVGVGDKYSAPIEITVKAMMPSNWGNSISAWVWEDGSNGQWATLTKNGDWWSYTAPTSKLNIIFVNGTTWTNNANQSVDITLTEDACLQINNNGAGKCTYTQIDCAMSSKTEYYIVAKRSSGNYYFLTPNKVSGKDRLVAVDAGTSVRSQIDTVNTTNAYLWTLEDSGTGKLLKSHNGEYLTCTAAKSASMASTGTVLNMANNEDGTVTFTYAADASTLHYLSLATAGNDYFVFYGNTNQTTHLLLMPRITPTNNKELYMTPNITNIKKVIHNGQLLIERNGKTYNAAGVLMK